MRLAICILISTGCSAIISYLVARHATIKHLEQVDGYLHECTDKLEETVIEIVRDNIR